VSVQVRFLVHVCHILQVLCTA